MKRKEAIKKLRQGNIQIFNDKGNDKEFIKLFFEAFPDSELKNDKAVLSGYNYGLIDFSSYKFNFVNEKTSLKKGIKIIKLSSITKPKNRLKQLEKGYRELKSLLSVSTEVKFEPDFENVKSEEKEDLEVGKWYWRDEELLLWNNSDVTYGFNSSGKFMDKMLCSIIIKPRKATPQEVEQALISETKKRGYNEKSTIKSFFGGHNTSRKDGTTYFDSTDNELMYLGSIVFKNGVWAEISEETQIKEEEIDWSKPQLVIVKDKDKVVATTGNHSGISFEGVVVITDNNLQSVGSKHNNWAKEDFKPFKGTLTINKE